MFLRNPIEDFPDTLMAEMTCPSCNHPFVLGTGVGVEDIFVNTSSGETKYGTAMFCSLKCVTVALEPAGRC